MSVSDESFQKFLASTFQLCLACCFAKFLKENNRIATVGDYPPLSSPPSSFVLLGWSKRASFLLVSMLKTNNLNKNPRFFSVKLESVTEKCSPHPYAHTCLHELVRDFSDVRGWTGCKFCGSLVWLNCTYIRAPVLTGYTPFPTTRRGKVTGRTWEIIRCPIGFQIRWKKRSCDMRIEGKKLEKKRGMLGTSSHETRAKMGKHLSLGQAEQKKSLASLLVEEDKFKTRWKISIRGWETVLLVSTP